MEKDNIKRKFASAGSKKSRLSSYKTDEILVIGLVISILVCLSFFIPIDQTGKATVGLNASIREVMDIEFTSFTFFPSISIIENQNITIEVQNTGSTTYNATMTVYVYNLSNGTQLTLLSTYADSTVTLYPGNTRGQKYIFAPATTGSYFIKGSVRYGPRVKEVWGGFTVFIPQPPQEPPPQPPTNQTNQTNQTQPPPTNPPSGGGGSQGGGSGGGGGGGAPTLGNGTGSGGSGGGDGTSTGTVPIPPAPQQPTPPLTPQNPSIALDYPERITVYRNITTLLPIKVTNDGTGVITGLLMFISTPTTFGSDVNPKIQQSLVFNQSTTYLISLFTSDAEPGEYALEFKAISGQVKREGTVILEVSDSPESLKDFIYLRIINYRIITNGIMSEILAMKIRGFDTTTPDGFIKAADEGLVRARDFYDQEEYVKAFAELLTIEENLKNAVFTLGNITTRLFAAQQPLYYLLIFLVPVAFAGIIMYRKRKDRRPRLLREAKEE